MENMEGYSFDSTYLDSHHKAVFAGLCLTNLPTTGNAMIIGLGGGAFPQVLHEYLPKYKQYICDLDPKTYEIAISQFGYRPVMNYSHFTGCDGVQYIEHASTSIRLGNNTQSNLTESIYPHLCDKMNLLFLDVNGSDDGSGLSAPPSSFITDTCLANIYDILCDNEGILAINVVARNDEVCHQLEKQLIRFFCCSSNKSSNSSNTVESNTDKDDVRAMIQAAMRGECDVDFDKELSTTVAAEKKDDNDDIIEGSESRHGSVYRMTADEDVVNRTLICIKRESSNNNTNKTPSENLQQWLETLNGSTDTLKLHKLLPLIELVQ